MARTDHFLAVSMCLTTALAGIGLSVAVPSSQADTVTAMEYYIDADPGIGNATPIPPQDGSYDTAQEAGEVTVNTTGLKPGPHQVYVRARSSNGVWGTYPPVLLYLYQPRGIETAEYYVDNDPGPGNGRPVPAVDGWYDDISERIHANVPATGLTPGNHVLYVRAKGTDGVWGPSRALPFEVLRAVTVSAAECGIGLITDTEPTLGTNAMQAVDFSFNSPVEDVRKQGIPVPSSNGTYRAFVRAKNDRNMWGPWIHTNFVVGLTPYQTWCSSWGLTGPSAQPASDAEGDGIPNVIEYGCNLNPTVRDRCLLQAGSGTNGLPTWHLSETNGFRRFFVEFVRRKNDPALVYSVRFSSHVVAGPWAPGSEPEAVVPINAEWERVRVPDSLEHTNAPMRFGRVWIESQP